MQLLSQDSTFVKYAYAGSQISIPEGEEWVLDEVFISESGSYNILISKSNFLNSYTSKEILSVPYYIVEMELLSNKTMITFQFYFKSLKVKN